MDFGTVLNFAQKNESSKQRVACYQTKFTPPKKQSKQAKSLSQNIKKFLARKEEEERQKSLEEKKKRENLLSLRDHKAQSRINKHLKVCKAANKSAIEDAIDNENTAVTIAGPSQPDEDDYGYVSQEASAFYNQLMNKYNNLPPEKPLFSDAGKKTVKDIASTKDRVKQALKQQEIEDALGHRRKRKSSSAGQKDTDPEQNNTDERNAKKMKEDEKIDKPKPKKKPPPPPMDFGELLKLAEKKQHEPVMIEVKPKNPKIEEPERLMTKKQMKEYQKEKEWREKKERERNQPSTKKPNSFPNDTSKTNKVQSTKISKNDERMNSINKSSSSKTIPSINKKDDKSIDRNNLVKNLSKDKLLEEHRKLEAEKKKLEEMRRVIEEEKRKLLQSKKLESSNKDVSKTKDSIKQLSTKDVKPRQFPPADVKRKLPHDNNHMPKQYSLKSKESLMKQNLKRPSLPINKRRIHDDDDDEEHDPELDDFIDDAPQAESEDYSKYISEIFGYDRNKYRNLDDDDDDDDTAMESNFAQQLREEYVSTKIGIMEDLEDIRMEALEKKRKALMRKKKIK